MSEQRVQACGCPYGHETGLETCPTHNPYRGPVPPPATGSGAQECRHCHGHSEQASDGFWRGHAGACCKCGAAQDLGLRDLSGESWDGIAPQSATTACTGPFSSAHDCPEHRPQKATAEGERDFVDVHAEWTEDPGFRHDYGCLVTCNEAYQRGLAAGERELEAWKELFHEPLRAENADLRAKLAEAEKKSGRQYQRGLDDNADRMAQVVLAERERADAALCRVKKLEVALEEIGQSCVLTSPITDTPYAEFVDEIGNMVRAALADEGEKPEPLHSPSLDGITDRSEPE